MRVYSRGVHLPIPAAEVRIDAALVRRLLRAQHPDLAGRPLRRIGHGWDNANYRVGSDLVVRIPRRALAATLIDTEVRWLPGLSAVLPLPVPTPVRTGVPSAAYPWPWSIAQYVPGRPIGAGALTGRAGLVAADALAGFLSALHVPAPADAPVNPFRGVPLADRAESYAARLPAAPAALRAGLDTAWREALEARRPAGPDTWVHGDLHGLNVLAARGRLTGVIDFGDLCAGDRATDLAAGWFLLDHPARERLRVGLEVEDATWARGQGWAVLLGLMFATHSAQAPINAAIGSRVLAEVVAGR